MGVLTELPSYRICTDKGRFDINPAFDIILEVQRLYKEESLTDYEKIQQALSMLVRNRWNLRLLKPAEQLKLEPMFNILKNMASLQKELAELNSNMKVKCFRKTVPSETNILVDFSNEIAALMTQGNKIVDCICGATINSNNALVYGKTAIQAASDWTYVYARVNQNYYDGLGGTTTVTLLAIYE